MLQSEHYQELVNEVRILQLINHRNKNQHRLSTWWKYFRLLLAQLKKIVLLQTEESQEQKHKENLESLQQEAINRMFQKRVFTKCYYEFNGIIALGQFLSLGLSLLSSLSKVHEVLVPYKISNSVNTRQDIHIDEELGEEVELPISGYDQIEETHNHIEQSPTNGSVSDSKSRSTEPESGSTNPDDVHSKKRKHQDKEKKKKKKKKTKSDIDLMFE